MCKTTYDDKSQPVRFVYVEESSDIELISVDLDKYTFRYTSEGWIVGRPVDTQDDE